MAPEVLQNAEYGTECDVYSFGIIMYEIFAETSPYYNENATNMFKLGNEINQGLRPMLPEWIDENRLTEQERGYLQLMQDCWQHDAKKRPSFKKILQIIDGIMNQ